MQTEQLGKKAEDPNMEEAEGDTDECSVVDPLADRLMKIFLPSQTLSDLVKPKVGKKVFEQTKEEMLQGLKETMDFLEEEQGKDSCWYNHLCGKDLADCVGNFLRQAGAWHTDTYATKTPKEDTTSTFKAANEYLECVVGHFIESTRKMEVQIKYPAEKRVPVLVITGFLGAGKTTLLNHILSADHGFRIAVIENEFGEVGIDDSLVKKRFSGKEEIFEMNNGCICCTVRGDLVRILKGLIEIRDRFDYVLIETTGMADPAPIAQTFFVEPQIGWTFCLDGILTVVDSVHVSSHLDEVRPEGIENESVEQLAFANTVLLNKLDLLGFTPPPTADLANSTWQASAPPAVQRLITKIRGINSTCRIIPTIKSKVDLALILHQRAFDLSQILQQDGDFLMDENHLHDTSVSSVGINIAAEMDGEKVLTWLSSFLKERGVDLYRFKGVLAIHGEEKKMVFQGVHMLLDTEELDEWKPDEKRVSKAVFIGRNLDRRELTALFNACVHK